MKTKLIFVILLLMFIFISTPAHAIWSQAFILTPVSSFDQMGVWWLANDKFADPAFSSFNPASGWWNYNVSDTNAYAFGPTTASITFDLNFQDPQSAGTDFLIMASYQGTMLQQSRLTYSGTGWGGGDITREEWEELGGGSPINPIPEPTTMLLFGIGTLGFGIFNRKKK